MMSMSTPSSPAIPPIPETRTGGANRLRALQGLGQSVWLDYLRHSLFTSGEFARLIAEDGLRGATSNPSIFEKAIAGSTDYLTALQDIELVFKDGAGYDPGKLRDAAKGKVGWH